MDFCSTSTDDAVKSEWCQSYLSVNLHLLSFQKEKTKPRESVGKSVTSTRNTNICSFLEQLLSAAEQET